VLAHKIRTALVSAARAPIQITKFFDHIASRTYQKLGIFTLLCRQLGQAVNNVCCSADEKQPAGNTHMWPASPERYDREAHGAAKAGRNSSASTIHQVRYSFLYD
jgi:hypothetical protein